MSPQAAISGDLFGPALPEGFVLRPKQLDLAQQAAFLALVRDIEKAAPLTKLLTKTGGYTSAAMTNCGTVGWWSDTKGYRYERQNPSTGLQWPDMPAAFLSAVTLAVEKTPWVGFNPDACLINFYTVGAKMGLHQDRDEKDFSQPIVTMCLGDDADFLVGGPKRGDKSTAVIVKSGDVFIMGGKSRLRFHGVRKIYPGTSPIAGLHGRYSLTFRKAL